MPVLSRAALILALALLVAPAAAQELPLDRLDKPGLPEAGDTRPPPLEGEVPRTETELLEQQLAHDGPPADGATLDCMTWSLNLLGPELGGVRLICDVSGAAADEVNLGLRVTLLDGFGGARVHEVQCGDVLSEGGGTCVAGVIDRTGFGIADVSVDAVLLPSGRTLGPIAAPFTYDKHRALP